MRNCYELLSVPYHASEERIKSAYRKKIKEVHPDTNPHAAQANGEVQELLYAYRILLDKDRRADHDASLGIRGHVAASGYRFHYQTFLLENLDDGYCCYRLVLYKLLKHNGNEAIHFFETFARHYDIFYYFSREDAMDCLFLLAEAYVEQGKNLKAFEIFMQLLELERKKSYFRHFTIEILDRVKYLVSKALPMVLSPQHAVRCIWRAMQWDYSQKDMENLEGLAQRLCGRSVSMDKERRK